MESSDKHRQLAVPNLNFSFVLRTILTLFATLLQGRNYIV